ncbi:MAG: excisionase family DNA-binding protein [bacterium]|nr:excisionase family DNA-binding protein [bacterium]
MSQFWIDRIFYDQETGVSRELIGLRELAKRLDVCYRTLLRAVHSGRLQAFAVGRQWKVWRDAVEQYFDSPMNKRLTKFRRTEPSHDKEIVSETDSGWINNDGTHVPF